jgi:hypothetical protein
MSFSRRSIILSACGTLGLVAAGGVWRVTRVPQTATRPWSLDPSAPADVRLDAFRHAILAPNPHNRQPWEIRLVGEREAVITCDLDRRLPQTDPFDRQISIGLGAFLEIAVMAAAQRGVRASILLFPDGEPGSRLDKRPVARLTFEPDPDAKPDPLFAQVLARRSNKAPYDMERRVPEAAFQAISALSKPGLRLAGTADAGQAQKLRDLIWQAFETEVLTPRTFRESIDLLRIGAAQIDANPDGIALKGPLFEALSLTGESARESAADPGSSGFKSTMARYRSTFAATPAFVWLVSDTNTRAAQIETGRMWLRLNLLTTQLGLGLHPVSQSLQEFPEMAEHYRTAHALLSERDGQVVQMLGRLGYGPVAEPMPRWPLETRLKRDHV